MRQVLCMLKRLTFPLPFFSLFPIHDRRGEIKPTPVWNCKNRGRLPREAGAAEELSVAAQPPSPSPASHFLSFRDVRFSAGVSANWISILDLTFASHPLLCRILLYLAISRCMTWRFQDSRFASPSGSRSSRRAGTALLSATAMEINYTSK